MGISVETLAVAKKHTDRSIEGITGSLAGKNATIESITDITGGHRVTFKWTADNGDVRTQTMDVMDGTDGADGQDGKGIKAVAVNSSNHLIITYDDDTTVDAGEIDIHSAVNSVNGKTGNVNLTASDVGALPDNTSIPSKTSDLTNDSDFVADASYVHTDNNYDATAKGIVDGVTTALDGKVNFADITSLTIYIDYTNGNDNNDGTTSATALKTVEGAYAKAKISTDLKLIFCSDYTGNINDSNGNIPYLEIVSLDSEHPVTIYGQIQANYKNCVRIDTINVHTDINNYASDSKNAVSLNGCARVLITKSTITVLNTVGNNQGVNIRLNGCGEGHIYQNVTLESDSNSTYYLQASIYAFNSTFMVADTNIASGAARILRMTNGAIASLAGAFLNDSTQTASGDKVILSSGSVYFIDGKLQSQVSSPTAGDFAALDANGNLIDSGKKASDFATPENVQAIQNQLNAQGVLGAKNLLQNTATTQTINNVAFTVNSDDKIVKVTRTAEQTEIATRDLYVVSDEDYKLLAGKTLLMTGCPSGGSNDTYYLECYYNDGTGHWLRDIGNGLTITLPATKPATIKFLIGIKVASIIPSDGLTFKPMLRLASDPDDTYQPYAMTNMELTEKTNTLPREVFVTTDTRTTTTNDANTLPCGFTRMSDENSNLPTDGTGGSVWYDILTVRQSNDPSKATWGYGFQLAVQTTTNANMGDTYVRAVNGGETPAWSAWKKLN